MRQHRGASLSVNCYTAIAGRHIALLLLTVAVAQASVTVTRTSGDEMHPSAMDLEVTLPDSNKRALIPLVRTNAFESVPMTVVENGRSRTFSSYQVHHPSHSHYRDIQSKSVISVRHVNGKRHFSGQVMHEGTSYSVEPIGESEHRVTKNVQDFNAMAKQVDGKKAERMQSRKKRQSLYSDKTTYLVEILLLTDHTVWDAFKKAFPSDDKALTEFHYYYTHILNGIDTAYRNIGTPSIGIRCIGFIISKTVADDAWMPDAGTADVVQAGAILRTMKTWTAVNGKAADHVMAFTRRDILAGTNSAVNGMAYMSGICTDLKQSISEDSGLHSWSVASHELAHNFGAEHDSDGNDCDVRKKNIMSPTYGGHDLSNNFNAYRFSTCSVDYIKKYINKLGPENCLTSSEGTPYNQLTVTGLEGKRLTLDQVCKLAYPDSPGKIYTTEAIKRNPALICAQIYCKMNINSDSGNTGGSLRAPAGTPCGNQKSCNWNGQCEVDMAAPVADESCFFGEEEGWNCSGWGGYIEYVKDIKDFATAKTSCEKTLPYCCKTLKEVCTF